DIQKTIEYPLACKDDLGRLRCGAAVGVGPDREERVEALLRAGVDVLAVDTAHGHSQNVLDTVRDMKAQYHDLEIIAGIAGTEESPGETILYQGRTYKLYRGMGSIEAMKDGSRDRYFQGEEPDVKLVPEGIEGRVAYKGSLSFNIHQLIGGLKAGMGYCG